jgi:hypothetical protein
MNGLGSRVQPGLRGRIRPGLSTTEPQARIEAAAG